MSRFADLHIHTYFSDGTFSPEEVVENAHREGLSCIAITDHDTVVGVKPTVEVAKKYDLEVIAGVELSCQKDTKDIHLLAYLFDCENKELQERIGDFQDSRVKRMGEMIEKLKTFGIDNISLEEVCALANSQSVGRPHLARILVEKGHVSNIKAAFDKYLAEGAPAYVGKYKMTPHEAIQFVHKIGGVAVLAHPMLTNCDEQIPGFVEAGLDGLEVYYANIAPPIIEFYKKLAEKYNLLATGGSDAHGEAKKNTYIGKMKIPYELVEKIKEKAARKR